MQIFRRETHIDFMKYRRFWIAVSLALVGVGVFMVFVHQKLNVGIDFAGGTQLTLRFREQPDVDRLRALVGSAGVGESQIQRVGRAEEHEVMIRTPVAAGTEEGSGTRVLAALDRELGGGARFDLNRQGADALAGLLAEVAGVAPDSPAAAHHQGIAEAIMGERKRIGLFTSWDQVAKAPGATPEILTTLQQRAQLGEFAVLSSENVGPQVGAELRRKGLLAVVWSLLGMLVYIWIRFELRFGVGALMATVHDVLVTLGLFALAGFEFNLTTIAAFLTLIGYSVNDTVVVFDRVRENLRRTRGEPLIEVMNRSINQTLSRTILTGGTVIMACAALMIWGGEVLRGFGFILTIGVVVGTYSSIYVASPFALLWERFFGGERRAAAPRPAAGAAPRGKSGGEPSRAASRR